MIAKTIKEKFRISKNFNRIF